LTGKLQKDDIWLWKKDLKSKLQKDAVRNIGEDPFSIPG
jgi:hypothetical protein